MPNGQPGYLGGVEQPQQPPPYTFEEIVDGRRGVIVRKYDSVTKVLTLTGSTYTYNFPIQISKELIRISMYFNTANARTFNVRMFANKDDANAYDEIMNYAADVSRSRIWFPDNEEAMTYLRPVRLEFNFSSFTASDTVSVEILTGVI